MIDVDFSNCYRIELTDENGIVIANIIRNVDDTDVYISNDVRNSMFSSFQCLKILGISFDKSRNVKFLNPPVCVDKTAVGRIAASTPIAEMIGNATVSEHFPKHDIS